MTSDSAPIRIMLVEDYDLVRQSLRVAFTHQEDFEVVGEARNREETLCVAAATKPDIVLLDLELGTENSLDFLPELLEVSGSRVIILTGTDDPELQHEGLALGAKGYLIKTEPLEVVAQVIRLVNAGQILTPARPSEETRREEAKISTLTPRERTIIALLGDGWKTPQVATQLHLNEEELNGCVNTILTKLQVPDAVNLVIYGYRHGLALPA